MTGNKVRNPQELSPVLVKVEYIAKALSVSKRQVGYWAEQGRIPFYKLGKRCVRYSLPAVLAALEIKNANH